MIELTDKKKEEKENKEKELLSSFRIRSKDIYNNNKNKNNKKKKKNNKIIKKLKKLNNILKKKTEILIETNEFTAIMTLFTLYALFGDDIRLATFPISADLTFNILSSMAFFIFLIEIILTSWVKKNYSCGWETIEVKEGDEENGLLPINISKKKKKKIWKWGNFYFWLDLIATASLTFEIPWMFGNAISEALSEDSGSGGSLQSARGVRASRAGARAGRMVRVVRMVRLVRLVRLYKYLKKREDELALKKQHDQEQDENVSNDLIELPPESHVGAAMSEKTTMRVISGVLLMLIFIPVLTYTETDQSDSFGLEMIHTFGIKNNTNNELYSDGYKLAENELFILSDNIFYLNLNGTIIVDKNVNLRVLETKKLTITTKNVLKNYDYHTIAKYNVKDDNQETSFFSIILTLFVILLLGIGTMFFSRDVNRLVIIPIETMVELVQQISQNPLRFNYAQTLASRGFQEGLETTLLLQTINKIGGLMRVGFGEAGADIIANNLRESYNNKLDLLSAGRMIESIFGFCDIRNFTDTTECLQEEVMLFVNRIAHILHSAVTQCDGAANKNIGDAFLMTWKIKKSLNSTEKSILAEKALYSFLKVIVELNQNQEFICSFSSEASRALYKRIPNYKVKLGFGLHVGWAVEGAIGSDKKIDASYISPHVNNSEYLESSTKKYGVKLLMSEDFFKLMSNEVKNYCRQVDNIMKSDSHEILGLYTYDCDLNFIYGRKKARLRAHKAKRQETKSKKFMKRLSMVRLPSEKENLNDVVRKSGSRKKLDIKESELDDIDENEDNIIENKSKLSAPLIKILEYQRENWKIDGDLRGLRKKISKNFLDIWEVGFNAYIEGNWEEAITCFQETLYLNQHNKIQEEKKDEEEVIDFDGPSAYLLKYMESCNNIPPNDWKGYHIV